MFNRRSAHLICNGPHDDSESMASIKHILIVKCIKLL